MGGEPEGPNGAVPVVAAPFSAGTLVGERAAPPSSSFRRFAGGGSADAPVPPRDKRTTQPAA